MPFRTSAGVLNAACRWGVDLPGIGMDGRACYGNVLFSMGPDTEFGGNNDTPLPPRSTHAKLYPQA